MPVKSYIAFAKPDHFDQMLKDLSTFEGCEIHPAENKEVAVLVTETENKEQDEQLTEKINQLETIAQLSLVSGYND